MSRGRTSRGRHGASGRGYRGGFPGDWRTSPPSNINDLPPERDILEGIHITTPPESISKSTLLFSTEMAIKDIEYIGSYNWTGAKEPTIIVPGSPPVWNDRSPPFTLSPDSGFQTIHQNGYRSPASPLGPLFAAVDTLQKAVDWASIDIIADRSSLRKLMRWIGGSAHREFRIDLELVGEKTVLFNRWETRHMESAEGTGYGVNFENETTNAYKGCSASTGHHRIIKYDFSDLQMVLRFEVDACLQTTEIPLDSSSSGDISDLLSGMSLGGSSATQESTGTAPIEIKGYTSPPLNIILAGQEVPQAALVELTTRNERWFHDFHWDEVIPQLYLSSTPHLYIGLHNRGTFSEVRKYEIGGEEMEGRKRTVAANFLKLAGTLRKIQKLARDHGEKERLSLVCREGVLEVYSRVSAASCLSEDVRKRFVAG
ncbi:hypothetical protein OF83DRAFT_1177405 [Amylostereum chailletii]|nr:hypothetical protein OF83DRAFT_1177405 [Amylostereum chailletii]